MNNNCLEGIRCPKCGQERRFFISGTSLFEVMDDGTEGHSDIEWDGEFCRCPECEYESALADFQAINDTEKERLVEQLLQDCYNDQGFMLDVIRGYVDKNYDLSSYRSYFKDIDPDDEEDE